MASLREQMLARVAAVLAAANTPAGANVFRSREVAITRTVSPAICVLYRGADDVQRTGIGADRHRVEFDVAIFVRGDPWDSLADAVDEPAHKALLADPQLKAMGIEIFRRGDDAEAEEADRTAGCLSVHYSATFYTRAGDIAAAP